MRKECQWPTKMMRDEDGALVALEPCGRPGVGAINGVEMCAEHYDSMTHVPNDSMLRADLERLCEWIKQMTRGRGSDGRAQRAPNQKAQRSGLTEPEAAPRILKSPVGGGHTGR